MYFSNSKKNIIILPVLIQKHYKFHLVCIQIKMVCVSGYSSKRVQDSSSLKKVSRVAINETNKQ